MFRLLPLIGPLLGIFKAMFRKIFIFLICFTLELLFFGIMAHLIFQHIPRFEEFGGAVVFLIPAAIGNFNFDDIENQRLGTTASRAFLLTFVIFNVLLVTSFFIAMITTLYRQMGKFKQIFFNKSTLSIRPVTLASKTNSVLISVPVPFSALHYLYISILLSVKTSHAELFNLIMLHIYYIPVTIVLSFVFLVWSLILFPFTFTKVLFHKLAITFSYSRVYRTARNQKFLYVFTWLTYGHLLLLVNILRDLLVFWIHLYDDKPELVNAERYATPMLPQSLEVTKRTLDRVSREQGTYVSIKEVMRQIREDMGLNEALQEQIFGDGIDTRFDEQGTDFREVLYSFNVIKRCLCNNTMVVKKFGSLVKDRRGPQSDRVIDLKNASMLISNIQRMRKLNLCLK